MRILLSTLTSILGAVILISTILPWFLIGVLVICILYVYAAAFYRSSARELKVGRTLCDASLHHRYLFTEAWYDILRNNNLCSDCRL